MTYNEDIARALCAQQQCDEDGVMCIVSRQAADEGAGLIRRLTASNDALRAEVERLREALTEIERIYLTECDADWRAAQMSAYATIELMDSAARATSPACQSGSATETTCEDEG